MKSINTRIGTSNNGRKYPTPYSGFLMVRTKLGIEERGFKYGVTNTRFSTDTMVVPGEQVLPTRTIYTHDVNIAFKRGSAVRLQSGEVMSVSEINPSDNLHRAFNNSNGIVRLFIVLTGGAPN